MGMGENELEKSHVRVFVRTIWEQIREKDLQKSAYEYGCDSCLVEYIQKTSNHTSTDV